MQTLLPLSGLCLSLLFTGQWLNAAMAFMAMTVEALSQIEED